MNDNEVACKHCGCTGLHWIRVQTAEGLKAMLANKNEVFIPA